MKDSKARPRPAATKAPKLSQMSAEIQTLLENAGVLMNDGPSGPLGRLIYMATKIMSAAPAHPDAITEVYDVEALVMAVQGLTDEDTAAYLVLGQLYSKLSTYLDALDAPGQPNKLETLAAAQAPAGLPSAPFTPATLLEDGGEVARTVLGWASGDVETAAKEILNLARSIEFQGLPGGDASLIRTLGLRVLTMNSLVISWLGPDNITLRDAYWKVFGLADGDDRLTDELARVNTATLPEVEEHFVPTRRSAARPSTSSKALAEVSA